MARFKPIAPAAAVQLQPPKVLHTLVPQSQASVQSKIRSPHAAPPVTTQESMALKQQQSLEMVQIMLHVSFGTLFYLREFLPLPCFDDRDLKEAQREPKITYGEFIKGKGRCDSIESNPAAGFGLGRRGQPLKIIVRGADPKADTLLDLLEHGIFDALGRRVLEAIQLTVVTDKEAPQNVIESYTFSFKYTRGDGDVNNRLESLSIDPVGYVADLKTAQTARVSLETIVRRLITLSAFLPTLPNKRSLGIHLFYTQDCPPDYEPPGFNGSQDETIKYPLDENWRKESQMCGTMDSGWHTVGLKVTSLKWTGADPEGSEALPRIPERLEYNDTVQRTEDIGFAHDISCIMEKGNAMPPKPDSDHSGSNGQSMEPSQESSISQEATQDKDERIRLQMMIPTQRPSTDLDNGLVPTQPINRDLAFETERANTPQTSQKIVLNPERNAKIRESQGPNRCKEEIQRPIRCQCGWDGEEDGLIECVFCHTRQHLLCYGYENLSDARIPDVHACYQCLLGPNEAKLLREMNSLVLLRRALRIILDEGFPNRTSVFMEKLHCNGQTVVQITELLKKKKFLQSTPGNKSRGFLRKGLPKYRVPSSEETRQRIKTEVLDPMVKIRHHYTNLTDDTCGSTKPATAQQPNSSPTFTRKDTNHSINGESQDSPSLPPNSIETPTCKRKLSPEATPNETYDTDDLEPMDTASQEQLNRSLQDRVEKINVPASTPVRDDKTSKQKGASPVEPSSGLRRSSRKKRKTSNYSRLIDVGAETSDGESMMGR